CEDDGLPIKRIEARQPPAAYVHDLRNQRERSQEDAHPGGVAAQRDDEPGQAIEYRKAEQVHVGGLGQLLERHAAAGRLDLAIRDNLLVGVEGILIGSVRRALGMAADAALL